jgi:hypothetical protein
VGGNRSSATDKRWFRKGDKQAVVPVMENEKRLSLKRIASAKPGSSQKKQIGPGKARPVEPQVEDFTDF